MNQTIEKSAKTVEDAINAVIEELKIERNRLNIEVIEEGYKGILGFIGTKMAKIRASVKHTSGEKAKYFLGNVFDKMKVEADIDLKEDNRSIILKVKGDDIGVIIGRRGETLDSLQYLTSLVVNKSKEEYKKVVIDIENYRQKREDTLVKLANKLAERVVKYKKSITLEPMTPYERRIIHATLQNNKLINTFSTGDEPNRKVVISLK